MIATHKNVSVTWRSDTSGINLEQNCIILELFNSYRQECSMLHAPAI